MRQATLRCQSKGLTTAFDIQRYVLAALQQDPSTRRRQGAWKVFVSHGVSLECTGHGIVYSSVCRHSGVSFSVIAFPNS
eukprot:m.75966 g.75966  ORF g.75966 m.75966 type:complete len:79 (-) comp12470_c0_seq1:213-449(-)